jgi:hypothetical protein
MNWLTCGKLGLCKALLNVITVEQPAEPMGMAVRDEARTFTGFCYDPRSFLLSC